MLPGINPFCVNIVLSILKAIPPNSMSDLILVSFYNLLINSTDASLNVLHHYYSIKFLTS